MTWERRFREMVLAGGAMAAAACADNAGAPANLLFCCNASSDPCCQLACGSEGPDASAYVLCEQDRTSCQSRDGLLLTMDDGALDCMLLPETGLLFSPSEAGPSDAASEANSFPSSAGCCNANPDPCCYMTCGDAGPDSSAYDLCEQDRATCQSHDGFYESLDDGALGCSFFPEAGPSDAGDGGDGHD
jgi:hypothetical protein